MSPNTERRYRLALRDAGLLDGDPASLPSLDALRTAVNANVVFKQAPQQLSTVERFRHDVETMLNNGAGPKAIFDKLHRAASTGATSPSLSAIKRFINAHHKATPPHEDDVAIVVHTRPGDVGQVDFGSIGLLLDPVSGELRQAYVFVMVLGFSRHMYARVVFDQKVQTFIQCHIEAFNAFGGVPRTLVPDNLKAAVIKAAFALTDEIELNRAYREMARHYGCIIDPTPARSPQKKGKVEAAVKYLKSNFFKTSRLTDANAVQADLEDWVQRTAGRRLHGTTGVEPLVVFEEEERSALGALPRDVYELLEWKRVSRRNDSHVYFDGRFYSLPWTVDAKELWVQASPHSVLIWADDQRVATHERQGTSRFSTQAAHLPTARADLAERDIRVWFERADRISATVGAFVRELAEQDAVLSPLRAVQAIVREFEGVGVERAERACARARHFGVTTAGPIKRMLQQGLEAERLPTETVATETGAVSQPMFARPVQDFLNGLKEVAA